MRGFTGISVYRDNSFHNTYRDTSDEKPEFWDICKFWKNYVYLWWGSDQYLQGGSVKKKIIIRQAVQTKDNPPQKIRQRNNERHNSMCNTFKICIKCRKKGNQFQPVQKCPVLLIINLYSRSPINALYLKIYLCLSIFQCVLYTVPLIFATITQLVWYTQIETRVTHGNRCSREAWYIIGKYCLIKTLIII